MRTLAERIVATDQERTKERIEAFLVWADRAELEGVEHVAELLRAHGYGETLRDYVHARFSGLWSHRTWFEVQELLGAIGDIVVPSDPQMPAPRPEWGPLPRGYHNLAIYDGQACGWYSADRVLPAAVDGLPEVLASDGEGVTWLASYLPQTMVLDGCRFGWFTDSGQHLGDAVRFWRPKPPAPVRRNR